mmetsp:Transcript_121415/g.259242  ORF Transcript_121415/g.259242 Transcript_121415/m.259242 type:complete len:349 (-) Transcript_121415:107-1153(-)
MDDRPTKKSRNGHKPAICLGTLTFGWSKASVFVDDVVATAMLNAFLVSGGQRIDTARCYSDGACEEMLGRCIGKATKSRSVKVDSKVNPAIGEGLTPQGVRVQVRAALQALRIEKIDVLYLHQPDTKSELSATLECIHELVQGGVVGELGLSNYSALETERCICLCRQHGWTPPTAYQGIYNVVNRWVEEELLPILRANDIRFVAYSPLAGGLLCKAHSKDNLPQKRVQDNPFYFNDECLAANARITDVCSKYGLGILEATYSWLLHHSTLTPSDGIVLGASSTEQLQKNLDACAAAEELPEPVVEVFESCWASCKATAYPYWRLYSKDMPNREELVQRAPGALFHCQ